MQVIHLATKKPPEVLTTKADVVVFSVDGKTAQIIVETELRNATVYTAGDPEFAQKARAYGFEVPNVRVLPVE